MPYPEYQQEFNDIIERIKKGTYQDKVLTLVARGLTDEDAAELCEAMRVVTEKNRCYITELHLNKNQLTTLDITGLTQLNSLHLNDNQLTTLDATGLTQLEDLVLFNNQLTTLDITGLTQLEDLVLFNNRLTTLDATGLTQLENFYLSGNPLTALTRAKLCSLLPAKLFNNPFDRITKLTPEEQTQVNNEFNEKVGWITPKLLELIAKESGTIKSIKSKLQSKLQSQLAEAEGLLLRPEDSVYIINEASVQVDQKLAEKRSILQNSLFLSCPPIPEHIKEKIIAYTCLFEHKDEIKNDDPSLIFSQGHRQENVMQTFPDSNAFAAPSMEGPISPRSPKP